MKKIFLIILISFLCVIGALGLGIGGMYLFGGFNEKIVYANELHFNKTEKVSAESIYLQIDTETPEVTRKKLKLVTTAGGENIVNFPSTVEIGEPFSVIPRQENGVNIGGNVTLIAYYDTNDANVNVQARCNILIDIPIKKAEIKCFPETLKPEDVITICEKGSLVYDAFNIEPLNSLVPYKKSGILNETIKETLTDKVLYLELSSTGQLPTDKVATLIDETGKTYTDNEVRIKYEYNDKNELVFANTIRLKAGTDNCDAKLILYSYSTYKDQSKNISGVEIKLNKNDAIKTATEFQVGSYEIDNVTIFGNTDDNKTIEKDVLLNKEVKVYLNNKDAGKNDINLNLELKATSSPNAKINNLEYKRNVYLKLSKSSSADEVNLNFLTVTKSDGTQYDMSSPLGLNIDCNGIGDQISNWYWVIKINDFQAYYKYITENEKIVVTLQYYNKDNNSRPNKRFNIIPTINEVDSLSPKYPTGEDSFRIKSGETLNLGKNDIIINANSEPTFTDIAFYLDYSENSVNSETTIKTIPTKTGIKYKAVFSFNYNGSLSDNQLQYLEISTSADWATIDREKCHFTKDVNKYNVYLAEVYLTINNSTPPADKVFDIKIDDTIIPITQYMTKFYEPISDVDNSYQSIPYLTVGGIRYYIDFDFVQEGTGRYLKINNEFAFDNVYKVSGIGSLTITAQLVYIEDNGGEKTIYWLSKKAENGGTAVPIRTLIHIDVYEELSSLKASYYDIETNEYKDFENTTFREDDETTHTQYIFITSNELEALKNYVNYGQIKTTARPYFTGFDVSAYKGIEEINKDAVVFDSNFVEVRRNGTIIGYRIAYTINPVHTIEINNAFIDNIFRLEISIEVNGKPVLADFTVNATTNNSLDIKVEDKIITDVNLNFNTSGHDGTSIERAIPLKGDIDGNGKFFYGVEGNEKWANNLRYYFSYNNGEEKIIDSMSYGLRILDEEGVSTIDNKPASSIILNNLYSCSLQYDEITENGGGRGGLSFKNFPIVYKNGESYGVLLEFSVESIDNDLDFNTHYYYDRDNARFLRKLNDGLSAKLYFRVYGLDINIEAKNNINNFIGFKGNTLDIFGDVDNTESIFNITVKNGDGVDITNKIVDYSEIFTTMLGSNFVSFAKTSDGKIDYSSIIVDKDVLTRNVNTRETISFSFHIGNTGESNQIKIKRAEGTYITTYYQEVKSAFEVNLTKHDEGITSPSKNVQVVEVLYKNGVTDNDKIPVTEDIANVSVEIVNSSLPNFDGITTEVVTVNSDNTLSFITVPTAYTVKIKVSVTKHYITLNGDGSIREITSANFEQIFDISVQPSFKDEDLFIGELFNADKEEDSFYYITAGIDGFATYSGKLEENKSNIKRVNIVYEDIDANNQVLVNQHMSDAFDAITSTLRVSSRNLNYDKNIRLVITLYFEEDGKEAGNFVYTKEIKVLGNMTLEFKDSSKTLNIHAQNNVLNLINDIYNLTINDVNTNIEFGEDGLFRFDYNDLTSPYNKNSFIFDDKIFEDTTPQGRDGYYYLRVRYENLEKDRRYKTIIQFKYVVDTGYVLIFDLEMNINIFGEINLSLVDGNKVLDINNRSEAINLLDPSLYNFTINTISQNERFKTEVLDKFDHSNADAKYNNANPENLSFDFDNEIFEDVTVLNSEADNTINNNLLLKVRYETLEKDKQYNTVIKFTYKREAFSKDTPEEIVFSFNFVINVIGNIKLNFAEVNKTVDVDSNTDAINLIDDSLYYFSINDEDKNDRFKTEVLDVFDYNNPDAKYNKDSFIYDSEIFEDVTLEKIAETGENSNMFYLKVKYDSLAKDTVITTTISLVYKTVTGTTILNLKLTLNILNG